MSSIVYTEENVRTLSDAAHIRQHPGMYIGNTNALGLHQLLRELLANSLDEVKAGFGDHIGVMLFADGSCSVSDSGRGISVQFDAAIKQPVIVGSLTICGYSPKLDEQVYRTLLGLHGVRLKVVAALSEWGEVETIREGERYRIGFAHGAVNSPLTHLGPANDKTGATVRFKPDPDIFGDHTFHLDAILHALCELAFLHPGVRFTFTDERTGCTDTFHFPDGILEFVKYLNTGEETLHEPIRFSGNVGGVGVEVAFQCQRAWIGIERGYSNKYWTQNGGTHITGFRRGFREAIRAFAKTHSCWPVELTVKAEDIREGVTVVVKIEHPIPEYEGATRSKLSNADTEPAVAHIVREGLDKYLAENLGVGQRICQYIKISAQVRESATMVRRKARDS